MPVYDDFRSRNITVESLSSSDTSDNERSTPTDAPSMSEHLKNSLNQLPLFGTSRRSIARARGSRRSSTARRVSPNTRRTQDICCLPRSVSSTPRKTHLPSKRRSHASTPKYYDYLDFLRRVIKLSQNQTAGTRGQSFDQPKPIPSMSGDTRRRIVRTESESDDMFDNVVNQPSTSKKSRDLSKSSKRPSDTFDYTKSPPSTSKGSHSQLISPKRPAQHSIGRAKSLPSFTRETQNQLADIGRSLDDLFDYTKTLPCTSKESQRLLESSSKGANRRLKEPGSVSEDSSDSTSLPSSIKSSGGPKIRTRCKGSAHKRSKDTSERPTSEDADLSLDSLRRHSQLRADSDTEQSPSTDTSLVAFAIPSKPLPNKPIDEAKKADRHRDKDKAKLTGSHLTKGDRSQSEIVTRPHILKPSISVSLPLPSNVNLETLKKLRCQKTDTVCSRKPTTVESISDSGMLTKKSISSTAVTADERKAHSASKRARSQSYDSKCLSRHSSDDTQRRSKLPSRRSSTHRRTSKDTTGKEDVKEMPPEAPLKDFVKPPPSLLTTKRPSLDKYSPTTEAAPGFPRPAIAHVAPTHTECGHSKRIPSTTKSSHEGTKTTRSVLHTSYSQPERPRSSISISDRRLSQDALRASKDCKAETQSILKDIKLPLKRSRHLSEGHIPKKIQSLSVSLPLPPNVDLSSLTIARRFSLDARSQLKDSFNLSQNISIPTVETETDTSSVVVESLSFAAERVPEVPLELPGTTSNLSEASHSQPETKHDTFISLPGPSIVDHTKIESPIKCAGPSTVEGDHISSALTLAVITSEINISAPCSSKSESKQPSISEAAFEDSNASQSESGLVKVDLATPSPTTSLLRNTAELSNSEIGSSNSMVSQQITVPEQVIPLSSSSSNVQIPLMEPDVLLEKTAGLTPGDTGEDNIYSPPLRADIVELPIPTIISYTPLQTESLDSMPDLSSREPSTLPGTAGRNTDSSRFVPYPRYNTPRPSRYPQHSWRAPAGQIISSSSSSRYASRSGPRHSLGPARYTGLVRPVGPSRGGTRSHIVQNRNYFRESSPPMHYAPRPPMFSPGPPRAQFDQQSNNVPRPPMAEPGQQRYPIGYPSHEPWPGPHLARGPRPQRYNVRHPRQHGYTPRYSPY